MKTQHTYSKNKTRVYSTLGFTALALFLGGCGKQESAASAKDSDAHDKSEVFASVAHSHEETGESCFICDPSKREKGRLWCREHDRYEDRCWLCHPELEEKDRLWCKEHSLYEDECFLCHPELKSVDDSAQNATPKRDSEYTAAASSSALFCSEHNVPEIECGICQPDLASLLQPGGSLKVRFPSVLSADKAGIRTGHPTMSEVAPVISAFCEIQYNLNSMAKVSPLVGGVIQRVLRDVGDQVNAGEALVELHSAEVASAKSVYLSALVARDVRRQASDRETRLNEQNISAGKDLLEADAAYRTSRLTASNLRQRLVNLGLTEMEIAQVERDQDTSARLVIRAPFGGTLIARGSVMGEAVEVGSELFTIADLSTHWLELSIPSDNIGRVEVGQTVEAAFPELPGASIRGSIIWVDTSVDPRTRMVRARALVTRGTTRLTTGLFGKARISIGDARLGAVVPRGAVQRHNGGDFVFVRNEPDLFALRRVALGNARGGNIEVVAGLDASDSVVTDGSFIVMSEFLKSRLGAGCVDD